MRRTILLLTMVAAVLLAFSGVVLAQQGGRTTTTSEDSPSFRGQNGAQIAPGKLIVKIKDEATSEDLEELNRRNGGASTDKQIAPNLEPGLHRVSLPRGLSVREAVGRYERSQDVVEYAEPDYLRFANNTPTDPYYSNGSLWGLHNTGQNGGIKDADIDAPEAWNATSGTNASSKPLVAVIDEGVDIYHPDLKANIWVNQKEKDGVSGKDDDGNGKVDDLNGWNAYKNSAKVYEGRQDDHGTHVAGTIGAEGYNDIGVRGVSWQKDSNWRTPIIVCKFLGPAGGYTSDAIECLDYVTVSGAKVSNNSWGGGGYNKALYEIIKKAGTDYGHVFVAAAGNEDVDNDSDPHFPSSYGHDAAVANNTNPDLPSLDNVIAVAATDKSDNKSSFSNYGDESVDLGAPGSGIYSTLPEKKYGSYSGTSMATPHVTGTVALVWAKDSALSASDVKCKVLDSGDSNSELNGKTTTGRRLNANNALNYTCPVT
jgi:thermitase